MSILADLLAGNAAHATEFTDSFDHLQDAQHPDAVTVCCSDSRVLQDQIWHNEEPGRLFSCGNIGNRVVQRTAAGTVVSGDVLYPVAHTGTGTVIVVGHTGCGAVTATYDALTDGLDEPAGIQHCIDLLRPSVKPGIDRLPDHLDRATAINHLVEHNVDQQIEFLHDSDAIPNDTELVGAVYDFQDVYDGLRGEVHIINIDGERGVATLRDEHAEIADRIDRLWAY